MHYCSMCKKMMPQEHDSRACWLSKFQQVRDNIEAARVTEQLEYWWNLDSHGGR